METEIAIFIEESGGSVGDTLSWATVQNGRFPKGRIFDDNAAGSPYTVISNFIEDLHA